MTQTATRRIKPLIETNMIVGFIEMHWFYYAYKAILSANLFYIITAVLTAILGSNENSLSYARKSPLILVSIKTDVQIYTAHLLLVTQILKEKAN